jgi:Holliday junction resolvase RusA-like endonuclease
VPREYVITVPGKPTGKGRPRFSRQGRVFTPEKTVSAENWVQACAYEQVGQLMLDGPLAVDVLATFEIPASWSIVKQAQAMAGDIRPTGKPDLDNIAKLYTDALNGVVWRDDAAIVQMRLIKGYGGAPNVVLRIRQIESRKRCA